MVSLLARDLALMKLVWWGGAITSHWTGARSAGLSSARLGCLVRCLRARSIPPLCFYLPMMTKDEARSLALAAILTSWKVDGDEPVILDDVTIERPFGWVFFTIRAD